MTNTGKALLIGRSPIQHGEQQTNGSFVEVDGETYYRIAHYDQIPPFFMSLVSGDDHWLFISSTGGLTAGRMNSESALLPYETDDKIAINRDHTGSVTVALVTRGDQTYLWEPFTTVTADAYSTERHIYKNTTGNKLIFEEINRDLGCAIRLSWLTSERFGFVRRVSLHNIGDEAIEIDLLDGVQNILPYGATSQLTTTLSNLLDAYKRSELDPVNGIGFFTLSATLTDQAEPSESLKATIAWQSGLEVSDYLLHRKQIAAFRRGEAIQSEHDVLGQAGAFCVRSSFSLVADETKQWQIIAEVNQDRADIAKLVRFMQNDQATIDAEIQADIDQTTASLLNYVAAADGLQASADQETTVHHFANVMFNIMRGGIFGHGTTVYTGDFIDFVCTRNWPVYDAHRGWFDLLPETIDAQKLYQHAAESEEADLIRLTYEYLPLTFSRRHGDPSRPWNRFSINLKHADGTPRLDYQGNWRDIFQNWEPLALSYPGFIEGMIAKFLNATTADGYNPYRVTRSGIEWEVPEPDNPWANIGYWSDHQIIYLQKLLELAAEFDPVKLRELWNAPVFAYADVPYRLKSYPEMLKDWYDTIDFDHEKEARIEAALGSIGSDAKLIRGADGKVHHVTMLEKLLALLMAKLTNLVPEGGIWMNTQRPEWNDANNALVGKGMSVVTTAYLRRFIQFWLRQLDGLDEAAFEVNVGLLKLLEEVHQVFSTYKTDLNGSFDDQRRRAVMDALGTSATTFREGLYESGLSTENGSLKGADLIQFLELSQRYIEHTLQANRRDDNLFHAYNILNLDEGTASVDYLYLMLEGQVAILSAGVLTPEESLALLQAMPTSTLYREDQHSYMLYPNRALPGFLHKNNVPTEKADRLGLVQQLTAAGDTRLLVKDIDGHYHFNGTFRNVKDAAAVLDELAEESTYADAVAAEREQIFDLFEETFNHQAFTGRSGTFFAFEGLGSIYWHMVSKLLLAVQENYFYALKQGASAEILKGLAEAYYDVRAGIGFNKSPAVYGAFPTDPYSHTPFGAGAKQPGMTGQVKEELMTRMGELGVFVRDGQIHFDPTLLRRSEFLGEAAVFDYVDVHGQSQQIELGPESLAFTFCQVPVVFRLADEPSLTVAFRDGASATATGTVLDDAVSHQIFSRQGEVLQITADVNRANLLAD